MAREPGRAAYSEHASASWLTTLTLRVRHARKELTEEVPVSRSFARTLTQRVAVPSILAALALGATAATAAAAPQAPGAPGTAHTWAPADKHGFGTARQLGSHVYFTLRQASLTEVYFPDLSTPSFRGLQFAVTDGKTFVDRETVDDDPRHIEPVAPGVSASVHPGAGSLSFRQVTQTSRWRLTKTWITDPGAPTVLGRIRFQSLTGKPLRLYVLADPAPGDDGNDDSGTSKNGRLIASDDTAATVVQTSPGLKQTTSGYRGAASDPWEQLQAHKRLRPYDALQPGNVVQGGRAPLDGRRKQQMTLAIGFGANSAAAAGAAAGSLSRGFGPAKAGYDNGWASYRASLKAPPASVAGNPMLTRLYKQSLLVLAASEDKIHRGAAVAAPNMPWIWGTLKLE